MRNIISASMSCILLAFIFAAPVYAEDSRALFGCAEWKSSVGIDMKALDKLEKKSASEKPASGLLYTKNQFVVLLGKDLATAKQVLANSKDKLLKTKAGQVDMEDVTLNGFNLAGLNFDNVNLEGAEMNGANLSGATLRGASIYKAELEGANLDNADLSFANVVGAELLNASLCQATLAYADIEDANILGAYLKGAKLDRANNIPRVIYQNAESVLHFGLPVPPEK